MKILSPIDDIILFSQRNESFIKHEFDRMTEYYSNPNNILELKQLAYELKDDLIEKDEFSALLGAKADKLLQDGNPSFCFNEDLLLDSYKKIYNQILNYPARFLKSNQVVKILFYDLAGYDMSNISNITLSAVSVEWRGACNLHLSTSN